MAGDPPKPKIPEQGPERQPSLDERRVDVQTGSMRDRVDVSLGNLEDRGKYDQSLLKEIESLKITDNPDRVLAVLNNPAIFTTIAALIGQLIEKFPDRLKNLSNFDGISWLKSALADMHLSSLETKLIDKLTNLKDSTGEVRMKLNDYWKNVLTRAGELAREAKALSEGKLTKLGRWAAKNKLLAGGALLLGAFAVVGIFKVFRKKSSDSGDKESDKDKGKDGDKKEPKKMGKLMKWVLGIGATLLTLFGVGKLLGIERVKQYLRDKWKWDIDDNRITRALILAAQGNIKEALDVLWDGADTNSDFHKQMASLINDEMKSDLKSKGLDGISGRTLYDVKDEKFESFISSTAEASDTIKLGGAWLGSSVAEFVGAGLKRRCKERMVIRAFLRKHETEVRDIMPIREKTIVDAVLIELYRKVKGQPAPLKHQPQAQPGIPTIPAPIQAKIEKNYKPAEQEQIRILSLRVYGYKDAQQKNIFAEGGLIPRLEHLSKSDAQYRQKIQEIQKLYSELEEKRTTFTQGLDKKEPIEQLRKKAEEVFEKEKAFEDRCAETYGEILPKMPGWAPIPLLARRYLLLTAREQAGLRGQAQRLMSSPRRIIDEINAARDPLGVSQRHFSQAEADLLQYEKQKGYAVADRAHHESTPSQDPEYVEKIRRRRVLEKRVAFEQKKITPGIPADELLKAEKEYLEAYQAHLKSNCSYFKNALANAGSTLSDKEKIELFHELMQEKKELRRALSEHRRTVMREVRRLGVNSPEAKKLVQELDVLTNAYRRTVREELSIWKLMNPRGAVKAFREWIREEQKAGFLKFIKNRAGHIGVMGLALAPALYFKYRDIETKDPNIEFMKLMKELGPDALQLLADVCPLTFGASDWYTVSTGREYFTDRTVTGWSRYSRIIWGSFGALLDAATLIPGIDLGGAPANAIMRGARALGKVKQGRRLIGAWPRIKHVAEAVGGWKKFGQHLQAYRQGKKLPAVAGMVKVVVPRLAATVMIGDIAYNAIYTMGDDTNDQGEKLQSEYEKAADEERVESQHKEEGLPKAA